ncbi:hypothetical protein BC828DRAFT_223604 [Blastocladiella britannica]|nr:hypothetical protein BC828DRAFT_223604 [Blastocladiella britannica]
MAESNNDALADFPSLAGMAAELGDDIRVAPAAAATSPLPKKRFSWRKIKLAFVGRAAYKDSDSARVDAALLPGGGSNGSTTSTAADDRIPSPSVSAVATPSDPSAAAAAAAQGGQVVLKTLRRFSAAVTRSLAGEGSNTPTGSHSSSGRRGSTASTTTVGGTHAGSAGMMTGSSSSSSDLRQGTPIEVEILAMVAAAKDADPVRFRNVVAPRDVFVNERGEHVVVFDALLELPLRDVSLRRAAELSRQLFSVLVHLNE